MNEEFENFIGGTTDDERCLMRASPRSLVLVMEELGLDLDMASRKKVGVLINLVYQHFREKDPSRVALSAYGDPSEYNKINAWVVPCSLMRIVNGMNSSPPPDHIVQHEEWLCMCEKAEA